MLGIKCLLAYGDSKVIIQQVNKDWECTKEKMDAYYREIRKMEAKFYSLEFHHVPRDINVAANILSKLRSKRGLISAGVFVQALNSPTVKVEEEPPSNPNLVPALGQEVLTIDTDGGRSMYLPVGWGPRIRVTTLLGDSATTTRRTGTRLCIEKIFSRSG